MKNKYIYEICNFVSESNLPTFNVFLSLEEAIDFVNGEPTRHYKTYNGSYNNDPQHIGKFIIILDIIRKRISTSIDYINSFREIVYSKKWRYSGKNMYNEYSTNDLWNIEKDIFGELAENEYKLIKIKDELRSLIPPSETIYLKDRRLNISKINKDTVDLIVIKDNKPVYLNDLIFQLPNMDNFIHIYDLTNYIYQYLYPNFIVNINYKTI